MSKSKRVVNITICLALFVFVNHFADQAFTQFNSGTNALQRIAGGA